MTADTPRDVMNRADGLRARARALDHMRVRMRLGRRAVTKPGRRLFFPRRADDRVDYELELTPQEDQLFYEWCTQKQREYEAEADRLDATLEVRHDR